MIRAKEIRVVDENGEQLGIMAADRALAIARERDLDLVEVAPGVNLEFDKGGQLIGVELFNASTLLKDVIKPMEKKIAMA